MTRQHVQEADCQSCAMETEGVRWKLIGDMEEPPHGGKEYPVTVVRGPRVHVGESVEVVPRSDAEALAEALEWAHPARDRCPTLAMRDACPACEALAAYRAKHPKETT